ncbi:MAG: transposase [Patescibacteria group bacterium]
MDEQDYFRFVHDLYEFNDQDWVNNVTYFFRQKSKDIASPYMKKKARKLLVDIHAFCLMPNHYHLLLSPRQDKAISLFMKKLNMGYAKYFNEKYKRTGALFEGRYKSAPITQESHFLHLPYYIHCNPLDLIAPEWRKNKLDNYNKAKEFLENYRWSSHLDYCGKHNFPSVTNRDFLLEIFNGEKEYRKSIYDWLKNLETENLKDLLLEKP